MEEEQFVRQVSSSSQAQFDKGLLKSSLVIKRLDSLHEKLSQGEYSPRNVLRLSEPSIDLKTALKIVVSVSLFMLTFELRRSDHINLILLKLSWIFGLLSFFYLFPPKNTRSLQNQLSIFFALRLLSSSMAYSFVTGFSFTYDMHIESQEYDLIVNLFLTMVVAFLIQKDAFAIKTCLTVQFICYLVILAILQLWFKKLDVFIFIHQTAFFLSFFIFFHLLGTKSNKDRDLMQATLNKHFEDLSHEVDEIRTRIEEESASLLGSSLNTSQVDELVLKIKYLKFTLLQREKEKSFLNARPIFANTRRRTYMSKAYEHSSVERKEEDLMATVSSGTELKQTFSLASVTSRASDMEVKWKISAEDCDNLVKLILAKQVLMWYPEVVKANESRVHQETAEFLKQHFTEVGNSLLNIHLNEEAKTTSPFESRTFEGSPWSSYLESHICTWNFDTLKFKEITQGNHMIEFGCGIMKKFNILSTLNTSPDVALSFLRDISDAYLPNPYHNSIHGVDVGNAVGYFLAHQEFGGHFSQLETACLVISALAHDLGHPGLNNAFLVATMSTEALLYNDQSVLENFHAASLFKILHKASSNILQNLSEKDNKYFRKLSINLILDTDLTKHFIIVSKFKNNMNELNLTQESDRFLSLSIALKCADICHGAKELTLHKKWSRRIAEEFFNQGDKEREYTLPVTPSCDRTGNISKGQHGFLTFIVLPLFEALDVKFFSEDMKQTVTHQIKKNLQYWEEEIPKEERGEPTFMKETEKILEDIAAEAKSSK